MSVGDYQTILVGGLVLCAGYIVYILFIKGIVGASARELPTIEEAKSDLARVVAVLIAIAIMAALLVRSYMG